MRDTIDPSIASKLFENILSACTQSELMLKNDVSLKEIIYHLEEILWLGFFNKNAITIL